MLTHTSTNSLYLTTNFLVTEMQYKAIAKCLAHAAINLAEKKLTRTPLVQEKFHQYTSANRIWSCVYTFF